MTQQWTKELEQKLDLAWSWRAPITEIIDSDPSVGRRAAICLADVDDPDLRPQVTEPDEDSHMQSAIEPRRRRGDLQAVESLIADLGAFDPNLRWRAAMVLGEVGDPRSVEPLTVALYDVSMRVAQMAASALGKIGDARAVEPLVAALHDGTEWRRACAAEALLQLGELALPALAAALEDKSRLVRKQARQILEHVGTPPALEALDQHESARKLRPSKLLDLTRRRGLARKQPTPVQAGDGASPARPSTEDHYRQDDIARGLRASLIAVLATALASGSADSDYLRGVFTLAQSQAALYGISWVDVISSLRQLPDLPLVARLQSSENACLEPGEGVDDVVEGEHTLCLGATV